MAKHNKTGAIGEKIAVDFLQKNGFEIISTNTKIDKIEVDILAKKNNEIVFIEVKTRNYKNGEAPEKSVSERQQKRLIAAADFYLQENNLSLSPRFDIIAITQTNDNYAIHHIEDAFFDEGE